jgi:hypothetical protein
MTKTIWKFLFPGDGAISMPIGAKILCIHEQRGTICLWAEVDPQADKCERYFRVYSTGSQVLPHDHGLFVFHVYEQVNLE